MPDYPAHWSTAAREAVEAVLMARPDIAGAEFAMLTEVGELITAADDLAAEARATSLAATGSTGQLTVSPLVVEARLNRSAAGTLLGKLVPPRPAQGSRGGNGRFRPNASGTGERR